VILLGNMSEEEQLKEAENGIKNPLALIFLKPGCLSNHGIEEYLLSKLETHEIKIVKSGIIQFEPEQVTDFYSHHSERSFMGRLSGIMSQHKLPYWVVEPEQETQFTFYEQIKEISRELRDKYRPGRKAFNVLHTSDSRESAARELEILGLNESNQAVDSS